jgi:hypothetical protein
MSTPLRPELHLDLSGQQEPLLLLDVSTVYTTCRHELHLDVSTLERPVLHLVVCTPQGLELHLKNLKNGTVLYVGLKITRHIIKSQIHLVRQSL